MRAAIATTTLVLIGLIWFSWDRLAPELRSRPASVVANTPADDVAAAPPFRVDEPVEAASPPPVPDMPDMPDERDTSAGQHAEGDAPRVHVVRPGDTLWSIAVEHYDDGHHARAIYEANRDQIGDPADLREGQELILP